MSLRVKQSLDLLGDHQPFANFELGLSLAEISILNKISIKSLKSYDNFGILQNFRRESAIFISSLGNSGATSDLASLLIDRLVHEILDGFSLETAWVSIRGFTSTDIYDVPRWHSDGYYYSPYSGQQHKVVFTLKGPGTLLCDLIHDRRKEFNELQCLPDSMEKRLKLVSFVRSSSITSLPLGTASIFNVGSEYSAIHSEPSIHSDRLFVSILPGTQAQITELYKRWQSIGKETFEFNKSPALS
jgi:hypothetical protein